MDTVARKTIRHGATVVTAGIAGGTRSAGAATEGDAPIAAAGPAMVPVTVNGPTAAWPELDIDHQGRNVDRLKVAAAK